ncbi:MAG: TIGR04255 family protein [Planctomycetes bacterium]|nr:TIGR04255 family protein [Planctomycetota bacterium]
MTQSAAARFRKPPVVEVWISVEFDPNENKREWQLELVQQYVELYQAELPKLEAVHERQIQVDETSPQALPKVIGQQVRLQFVRMSNGRRTRALQIGDDQLSFHVLKEDQAYPGYRIVRDEMQRKLDDYARIFQPTRIRNATLHYLDIIDIPRPESGEIDLPDYFVASIDLPEEPFGQIGGFAHRFQMACPVDPGPLLLQLQAIPSPPESNVFRFRMDWHKQSAAVNTLDLSQVWSRMDVAHDYMRRCFLASFTQRTLELFDPVSDTE